MITQLKDSKYPYVLIFQVPKIEIEKIDFALCKQPSETLDSYYKRQTIKPALLSNGGLFNMKNGETYFNYKDENSIISTSSKGIEGFGVVNNNQLVFGTIDGSYKDFVSGYPVLIKDSVPVKTNEASDLNYATRRTILAYDNSNVYLIGINSPGLNFTKMKEVLQRLKCTYAINLDGGGSTRILKEGKLVTEKTKSNRPVDNVVAIYLKPAAVAKMAYKAGHTVNLG